LATVKKIEARIKKIEGFNVQIRHQNGRDVRSDRGLLPAYPFERMLKNSNSVSKWKRGRFKRSYPGFEVDVLDASGDKIHGRTRLSNVRDTYLGD
jgi:hypothetical protein